MKFIFIINENEKLKEENWDKYYKSLVKWSSEKASKKFNKILAKAFEGTECDMESTRTDKTLTVSTHNEAAARALYLYYRQIDSLVIDMRIESDIIKEDDNSN